MVISRTGAETDEDDISKILQHSYFNAGEKVKTLRKNLLVPIWAIKNRKLGLSACRHPHGPDRDQGGFPQADFARRQVSGADASANATAWRPRPPGWPPVRALIARTRPSSALAVRIPDPLRTGGGKRP